MSDYLMADDLSGALEAGAAFRARGRRVIMPLGRMPETRAGELRVLSTETRNSTPEAAALAVQEVVAREQAGGPTLRFKKIDSTLRGPVGAELRALGEILAPRLLVICPATPAAGRTVRDGVLLVHGVPVAASDFRHDPGWPVTESRVQAVLESSGIEVASVRTLAELRQGSPITPAAARGVMLSDAETADDLRRLVAQVRAVEPGAIFAGGGGLAHAVAAADGAESPEAAAIFPASVLFVSGSASERSRRQFAVLRDDGRVPLHEIGPTAPEPAAAAAALAQTLRVRGVAALAIARSGGELPPHEPRAWLEEAFASLLRRGGAPELLVATGGETARALCEVAGLTGLEVLREIEPGVVLTAVATPAGAPIRWVLIKPGGFGSDRVWTNLLAVMSKASMK